VPSLTTIRQPLKLMGSKAARALLQHLAKELHPSTITVAPELIIRESTARVHRPGTHQSSTR
jgi:DNA-binding LacI/PurR family transcriptional regulator